MAVPYTFGSATSAIPLSQLDSNFATTITLGNTAIQLGNTVTTLNNMTLANVTVTTVSGASANAVVYTNSSGQVTANSSVIALDTSGNLGLGVTPSVANGGKNVEVGTSVGNIFRGAGINDANIDSNAVYNSGWKYANTGYAGRFAVGNGNGGGFYWFTAPSGTAGNAITFTQAMTLDASGNLGIGTTTTSNSRLSVVGDTGAAAAGGLVVRGKTVDYQGISLFYAENGASSASARAWQLAPNYTANGNLEFRVSASSTTNPSSTVMTLDSSGNFIVGATAYSAQNANYFAVNTANGNAITGHANGTPSGYQYAAYLYNGGLIGSITQNGTTGVLYNLTSDYRLKNNPVPVTGAKEFIMALQPKTWDWWDGSGKGVGFIAHEFMEVAKYSGHGEKDAVEVVEIKDEDGNVTGTEERPVYQSIQPSSSEVMANLVALLQEQQAIITDLTNRITALEGAK